MSGGYDDELSRPLEGALEASTSEGPTSPAVGRDEWVARHGDNRIGPHRPARHARGAPACRSVVGLADDIRRSVLPRAGRRPTAATCGAWHSTSRSTCCSRSGSTSSSAGAACSTSGTSRSSGSAPTPTRSSARITTASTCRRFVSIPLVVVIGAVVGFLVGLPSRRLTGRLPRDRDALLPPALPHRDDERRRPLRSQRHRRSERAPQRRPAQPLRSRVCPPRVREGCSTRPTCTSCWRCS